MSFVSSNGQRGPKIGPRYGFLTIFGKKFRLFFIES